MDPVIISIVAAVGALTFIATRVIYVTWLTFSKIGEIFQRIKKKTRVTKQDIGFITMSVNSDKCSHIGGIFNKNTGELKTDVPLQVDSLSSEVERELRKTGTILLT